MIVGIHTYRIVPYTKEKTIKNDGFRFYFDCTKSYNNDGY
jgi:hypothetical protein